MDCTAKARVRTPDGGEAEVGLSRSPNGPRSFYVPDDKSPAVKLCRDAGIVTDTTLGDAMVQMIRAQDVVNTLMKVYHEGDPAFLLCEAEESEFSRKGREACEREFGRIKETIEKLVADGWCRLD